MNLTKGIFYHLKRINRYNPYGKVEIGDKIETSNNFNPFFEQYNSSTNKINIGTNDDPKFISSYDYFRDTVLRLSELTEKSIDCRYVEGLAKQALSAQRYYMIYARELLWEKIRKDRFKELPSRQRCIWLASDLGQIKFWKEKLGSQYGEYQVLKLECTGNLHRTFEGHLTHGYTSMVENTNHAMNYWSGIDDGSTEEILFEGFARVIEIIE